MTNDLQDDALLDALRRVGVVIPDAKPISLRSVPASSPMIRRFWNVICGDFDTMVDWRDAQNQEDAISVALTPLHPWYVRRAANDCFAVETPIVKEVSRNEYIDWLQRGVK